MSIDISKLKRYKPGYVHSNDGPAYLSMLSRDDGEYVRLDDVMALAALSSHRQAGDDLSKFRELAERWRVEAELANRNTEGNSYDACADELLALVEKGAG